MALFEARLQPRSQLGRSYTSTSPLLFMLVLGLLQLAPLWWSLLVNYRQSTLELNYDLSIQATQQLAGPQYWPRHFSCVSRFHTNRLAGTIMRQLLIKFCKSWNYVLSKILLPELHMLSKDSGSAQDGILSPPHLSLHSCYVFFVFEKIRCCCLYGHSREIFWCSSFKRNHSIQKPVSLSQNFGSRPLLDGALSMRSSCFLNSSSNLVQLQMSLPSITEVSQRSAGLQGLTSFGMFPGWILSQPRSL